MANGQRFHQKLYLAASRDFPLGSVVSVRSVRTGRSVLVTITDRGPWTKRFQLDLSKSAFQALGLKLSNGWAWVNVERME
jgi:rare lipoprotein A